MSLKRWLRLTVSRWWIVVLAAALGGAGGYLMASTANESIEPLFEARAVFEFQTGSSDRNAPDVGPDIDEASTSANSANSEILSSGTATVATDTRAGTITFGARSRDAETARATVESMQLNYLVSASEGSLQAAEARISEIVGEASDILIQLEELAPPGAEPIVVVADPKLQAELAFLNSQVAGLTQRSVQLAVERVAAETGSDERIGTPEEIDEELAAIEVKLGELNAQIAELTLAGATSAPRGRSEVTTSTQPRGESREEFEPVDPGSLQTTWTVEALQARFEELKNEHQALLISSQAVPAPEEGLVPISVDNISPAVRSLPLTAVLGAIALVLLTSGAILALNRIRRPILTLEDVPPSLPAVQMPRMMRTTGLESERFLRLRDQRARGARELRNTVLDWFESSDETPLVGVAGVKLDGSEVEAVALDLARSLAASDRSVLIIDLYFPPDSNYSTSVLGASVAETLGTIRRDPGSGAVAVKQAASNALVLAPRIRMLQAGNPGSEPTDVFVTTAFKLLLEQVKEHADVVLALLPPLSDETTEMVRQRLDGVLAVCQRGKTRVKDLRDTPDGEPGRLIGVVLLTKWRRPGLLRRFTSKSSILLTDLVDAGRADVGFLSSRKAVRVSAARGPSNNGAKQSSNGFAGADDAVKVDQPGKR